MFVICTMITEDTNSRYPMFHCVLAFRFPDELALHDVKVVNEEHNNTALVVELQGDGQQSLITINNVIWIS